jgi:outer membrane protein TolC
VYRQHFTEQVAFHYYTAVTTETLLNIQQESQADAEKLAALVESRFEQGVVDQSAVNRALINRDAARQDELNYRDVLEQAHMNLRILLGIPADTVMTLTETTTFESHKPSFTEELGPDRGLVMDELAVSQARYQLLEVRATRWPTLTIDAYLGTQQLQDDLQLSFESDDWSTTTWVALTLSVPLFTGLSRRNQILAADAAHNLAIKSYERKKEEAHIIEANLVARLELYRQQVSTTRQNYNLSRDNASLALRKYEQGVSGLEQYLNAREDQRRSESAFGNALLTYYRLVATFISRRL